MDMPSFVGDHLKVVTLETPEEFKVTVYVFLDGRPRWKKEGAGREETSKILEIAKAIIALAVCDEQSFVELMTPPPFPSPPPPPPPKFRP